MATEQEIRNAERRALNLESNSSLQDIRNQERLSENLSRNGSLVSFLPKTNVIRDGGLAGYGTPGMYSNPENAAASFTDTQLANFIQGFDGVKSGGTRKPQNYESVLAGFLNGSGSGGSSGNRGPSASDRLARDQFNYGKQQDALARERDARATLGLQNYYDGGQGQFNSGFDNLLKMITDQGKVSSDAVGKSYDRAMTGIGQGYDAASGLGTAGFDALNTYLQANPNNPYAGMTAQVGSAPDALTDYLSAYGVSDAPVQGQIQADLLQAQQGAGNFQNLVDVLSGVAQQGAGSRGAESQMAQLLFNTGLGQDRAGYTSQAENAQAAALAQLQQQMFSNRFGVEGDRNSLANQLAMAVINAGGDIDNNNKKKKNDDGSGPLPGQLAETATPQEIVANQLANLLAPAQAQGNTTQQLLNELNARRGR